MNSSIAARQHIIEIINNLPDDFLSELANFIDYLHYKSTQQQPLEKSSASFLLSVAGIGTSAENNISERDEEILASEVDPIRGFSLNLDEQE
jgi:Protein of unknown function (DUF2281)